MSDDTQFKVRIPPAVQDQLEASALALGFHSANALAAVLLTHLAPIPPHKVFEALGKLEAYSPRPYKGARKR